MQTFKMIIIIANEELLNYSQDNFNCICMNFIQHFQTHSKMSQSLSKIVSSDSEYTIKNV
jgi:hypothetical protein